MDRPLDEVDDATSRPDEENPEITLKQMRDARPALEWIAEQFGPEAAESLQRGRGRPTRPDRKVNQTLRLDPDVVAWFKRQGPGWQARINALLREFMGRN